MVMAASNCPWDLDEALRRRFDKRIYIGLPEEEDRRDMFEKNLDMIPVETDVRFDGLANATSGYSGADIRTVCREVSSTLLGAAAACVCSQHNHCREKRKLTQWTQQQYILAHT
jgi:SpoVK/Ycf46/Vps4 family AAA+-type ATPase